MAKLKAPLLSLKAIGSIADFLTFDHRRRTHIVQKKPIPTDARSAAQLPWRHMFQKATALWKALSTTEKQEWETLARRKRMTGYAWFISQALKPNPGLYLPLQGGTMQGTIDMVTHRILHLPAPIQDEEPARLIDLGAGGTFIGLTDTPASYAGQANKAPLVNPAEDTLIFQILAYLALAGGTMAGPIAMATNKITGLGDPTAAQDAATKVYVDTLHALQLLLAGGTMAGNIDMNNNIVSGMKAPIADGDAARKKYTDDAIDTDITTHANLTASHGVPRIAGITHGNYTGNDGINRAIPHGLGRLPLLVLITNVNYFYRIFYGWGNVFYARSAAVGYLGVTALSDTNFFVGNATSYPDSANASAVYHIWVAIG